MSITKVELLSLSSYSLWSLKVQEAEMLKMADFLPFSWSACPVKTLQLSRGSYPSAHILRLCPCLWLWPLHGLRWSPTKGFPSVLY